MDNLIIAVPTLIIIILGYFAMNKVDKLIKCNVLSEESSAITSKKIKLVLLADYISSENLQDAEDIETNISQIPIVTKNGLSLGYIEKPDFIKHITI